MAYPVGMSTCTVEMYLDAIGGKFASGQYRCETDRTFGFTGSPWVMQQVVRPNTLLASGWLRIELPHTDQAGLLGDDGAALDEEPAYRISVMPTGSPSFGNAHTFYLPTSLGTGTVPLSTIADLGGWPSRVVIVNPPPTGGGAYVPVTVSGNSGYWSPA